MEQSVAASVHTYWGDGPAHSDGLVPGEAHNVVIWKGGDGGDTGEEHNHDQEFHIDPMLGGICL